ncbi:NAD(P)H-binding protein [Mycolicibacterium goodii]|uniref:NAD(P)H-binding protein n=1 Tax=Mycolicibacterium goodii TaxID=134601 RepID=A0ABS6HT68_MYCGD|nr:NAD(P)H-binding protein [Mycolicibacterium goodii]MBU8825868.1 NAD(P)H-binding protein [Mycolicibacterium goodii]MBU8840081.1 NAD(P)H-binding protein [Mycolicibacterium goodii]
MTAAAGTPVLVLGATGNTGSAVVEELRSRPGVAVRTASRKPKDDGTDHVRFDWSDPVTHADALRDVQRMYLVAPVGDPHPIRLAAPFLERAATAGVERVVMLSSSAVTFGGPILGEVAAAVRDLFAQWEILRPSWFMQNFVGAHPLADQIRATGEFITSTGDGKVAFIDAHDIARSAARLLVRDDSAQAEHRLTGPEALSYGDAAAIVASVTGRALRHRAVTRDEYVAALTASGYDAAFADVLAALDDRIRAGLESTVTDTVERLTGVPPRSFADFMRRHTGGRP